MKWLKRIGVVLTGILIAPFVLLFAVMIIWLSFEAVGAVVNHISTDIQTNTLQSYLRDNISDIEIIGVRSDTGNTSGTGNHVDCYSEITFTTDMDKTAIESVMRDSYKGYIVSQPDNAEYYIVELCTSAPFKDNIEGH